MYVYDFVAIKFFDFDFDFDTTLIQPITHPTMEPLSSACHVTKCQEPQITSNKQNQISSPTIIQT